jgi:hypothetical protein
MAIPFKPEYPILKFFAYAHLPPKLQPVSKACADLAFEMVRATSKSDVQHTNIELAAGLRKLLEAKDAFVRAALDTQDTTR